MRTWGFSCFSGAGAFWVTASVFGASTAWTAGAGASGAFSTTIALGASATTSSGRRMIRAALERGAGSTSALAGAGFAAIAAGGSCTGASASGAEASRAFSGSASRRRRRTITPLLVSLRSALALSPEIRALTLATSSPERAVMWLLAAIFSSRKAPSKSLLETPSSTASSFTLTLSSVMHQTPLHFRAPLAINFSRQESDAHT